MALEARDTAAKTEKNRGRVEVRSLTVTTVGVDTCNWPGLQQFIRLERRTLRNGVEHTSVTYAITSVPREEARAGPLLTALRGRWHIENRAFWVLDHVFGEDHSRIRTGRAPHAMHVFRTAAINFLRGLHLPIAQTLREHAFKVERLFSRLGIMNQ